MKKQTLALVVVLIAVGLGLSSLEFQKTSAANAVTVTIYADPGRPGAVSVDGDTGTNNNTSYASARSVADCIDCSSGGIITTEHSVGVISGVGHYSVIRALMNFDTSVLGPDATILSATVLVRPEAQHFDFTADGGEFVRLVTNSIASNNNYSTSDFNSIGTVAQSTNDALVNSMSTGTFVSFPLNAAGLSNIRKSGVTHFGMRLRGDINSAIPVAGANENWPDRGGALVFFDSADAGQSVAPKIIITYIPGGVTPTPTPTIIPTPTPSTTPTSTPTATPTTTPTPTPTVTPTPTPTPTATPTPTPSSLPITAELTITASQTSGTVPFTVQLRANTTKSVSWYHNGSYFSSTNPTSLLISKVGTHVITVFAGNSSAQVTIIGR